MAPESTKKISTYSPPRRESIGDHLDVIAQRADWFRKWVKLDWSPGLASTAWVQSLATKPKKILDGPLHEGAKHVGAGVRSRFSPSAYRELLEVIRLKSQGVRRRNAWVLHLWFRGHEYPFERVRAAAIAETRHLVGTSIHDFAPTGRFKGNFSKRAQRLSSKAGVGDHAELLHLLYALSVRPSEMQKINISAEHSAALLCEGTQTPISVALPLTERLLSDIKSGAKNIDPAVEVALAEIVQQSPHGRRAFEAVRLHPNPSEIAHRMHGLLADDRGRSRLINAIANASEEHFKNARKWRTLIRSSFFGSLQADLSMVPAEHRDAAETLCTMMLSLRRKSFASHDLDVNVFAAIVDQETPVAPPDIARGPVDADAVLRILKNRRAREA